MKYPLSLLHTSKSIFIDAHAVFEINNIKLLTLIPEINSYIAGYNFSPSVVANQSLDKDLLERKLKLIWHAIAATQIELGYFLVCFTHLNKLDLNEEEKILTKALTLNHLSLAYECIYRVWEKITFVLYYLHYKKTKKKLYYDGLISILELSNQYEARIIVELKKHIKHWGKVASIRNKFSHEESVLFSYDYQPSNIVDQYGIPIYMTEIVPNIQVEVDPLVNRFKYLETLNNGLRDFMDNMPVSRIIIL